MRSLARMVLGASLALSLAGCMSMDEMLASEDAFWRDVGETKAVAFAIDGANPLEKRLEVVPKIANQQKLAQIVLSKRVAPEVKVEARKRINAAPALAAIALDAPDRNDQMDALSQIAKSEDSRIEAAWIFAERKPSSNALQTLLTGLSDAGRAKFAASFAAKIDAASAASSEVGKIRKKYGDSMASGKQKELRAILKSLVCLAPFVEDDKVIATILTRQDVADVKGSEYDFLTPLEGQYQRAVAEREAREAREFLDSLTDEERVQLLNTGKLVKGDKTVIATDGGVPMARGNANCTLSRQEIMRGIKDAAIVERLKKEEAERRAAKEKAERLDRIKTLGAKEQKSAIDAIKDPVERKNAIFALIDSVKAFKLVTAEQKELLATIPAKDLAAQLRMTAKEMKGNEQQYRASGPACALAIKDQSVIKDLLVDDPAWAHEMGLEEDFGMAYTALLENCTDDDILEAVFRDAKPDEHDRIVSKWELRNVFKRMSSERQAKLLAEAKSRTEEAAKTNVVVKGFYLGMGLGDYCLINHASGMPAKANVTKDEKVSAIYFDKENRDKFLDVGKGIPGITKFATLYGKVSDGIDLSQNDRTETKSVVRSIKHLNFEAKGQHDRYRWEYSHFAKYVDTVHNFQAEIKDETGELTIRYPVDEGVIGVEDKSKEEEKELVNALF